MSHILRCCLIQCVSRNMPFKRRLKGLFNLYNMFNLCLIHNYTRYMKNFVQILICSIKIRLLESERNSSNLWLFWKYNKKPDHILKFSRPKIKDDLQVVSQLCFVSLNNLYIKVVVAYRASHIKSDYLYALQTKIRTWYLKNLVFSGRKFLQSWPHTIF